jgi:DNA-directed RNA polymerase subunit RPC12/RpoP
VLGYHRRSKMKRSNVFLVITLVIITGVILTSCGLSINGHSNPDHCPYCNSTKLEEKKPPYIFGEPMEIEYKCKKCGKEFYILQKDE